MRRRLAIKRLKKRRAEFQVAGMEEAVEKRGGVALLPERLLRQDLYFCTSKAGLLRERLLRQYLCTSVTVLRVQKYHENKIKK
jgi:hypothetical protein